MSLQTVPVKQSAEWEPIIIAICCKCEGLVAFSSCKWLLLSIFLFSNESFVPYLLLQFELQKKQLRKKKEATNISPQCLKKGNAFNKCLIEKVRMHSAGFCLDIGVKHGQVSSGVLKYIWCMWMAQKKSELMVRSIGLTDLILWINSTNGSMTPHICSIINNSICC